MVLKLWDAAREGDLQGVKNSIKRGESIEGKYGEFGDWDITSTPLQQACRGGHTEIVHYLVNHGADIYSVDKFRRQPLHYAVEGGNVDIVQFLLEHGADVRCEDARGNLPLHLASFSDRLDIVKLLVNKASDISSKNNIGQTALHRACRGEERSVAEYLVEHGAEIDAQDAGGYSPFHHACLANNLSVVHLLVTKGVDIALKTKDGKSGLQLAEICRGKNCDVAVHLREKLEESQGSGGRLGFIGFMKKTFSRKKETVADVIYNDAYYRALEVGQAKNTRIPIMIVGQDRAGKTSLKKHLLGLPFDDQQPSTVGIEIDVVEITEENAEEPWKRKEVKQFIMHEDEVKEQILEQTAQFAVQKKGNSRTDKEQNTTGAESRASHRHQSPCPSQQDIVAEDNSVPLKSEFSKPVSSVPKPKLSKVEIDDIKSRRKDANADKRPPIRGFVHDFAGQNIFHDTHYHFLRLQCPYVLVYDLTVPLDEPAQPRFKPASTPSSIGVERNLTNPLLATNLDHILSWLTVLARLNDFAGETVSDEFSKFKLPPVLIVLTNSDRFEGDVNKVKERIRAILIEKGFKNVYVEPIIISNKSSGDGQDEVRQLRGRLFGLCKSIQEKQRPVPIRWLQFEAALSNKMIAEKLNHISIEEAHEVAETCNVTDVDAAIRFLHHQGMIVHHIGSPVVILNPQWLMNLLAEIITVPQEDNPSDALYRKLMTKGILMQKHLEGKDHGKLLQELMQRFGLICPWEHEEGPAFIVPSVAPLMEHGEDVQDKLSASPIAPVFITFNSGYLLPGLFTRFIVKVINECREFLRNQRPRLYCNYTLLSFKHNECKFDVYIIQQLAGIRIGVVPGASVSQRYRSVFVSYLKRVMIDCLTSIKDDDELYYRNIDFSFAAKCPVCFGDTARCLRHDKEKCEHDDCGHFWLLDDLQRSTEDPVCPNVVLETGEFSLERVQPWINTDEVSISPLECEVVQESCSGDIPDELQPPELVRISQRIASKWVDVAFLTGQFEPHEIDNIRYSRIDEDASTKARTMLELYLTRDGGRRQLCNSVREVFNKDLAQKVLSGYFIDAN